MTEFEIVVQGQGLKYVKRVNTIEDLDVVKEDLEIVFRDVLKPCIEIRKMAVDVLVKVMKEPSPLEKKLSKENQK